jgi:hypothetical protein
MFAPKVAKPQAKVAAPLTSSLSPLRSGPVAHRTGQTAVGLPLFLQQSIGNQALLRLLPQPTAGPTDKEPGADRAQGITPGNKVAKEAPRGVSWNFGKIPLFPPDRATRAQSNSSPSAPLLPHILKPKLALGEVNDPLEHEADRVAEQVMRTPDPEFSIANASPQLSHRCSACGEGESGGELQAKRGEPASIGSAQSPAIQPFSGQASGEMEPAPGSVERVLATPGKPLERGLRAKMEAHFAQNFSRVRVHSDLAAGQSALEIGANAYTVGHHIVFGANRFLPETPSGRRLLAHELTHVVQQTTPDGAGFHQSDGTPYLTSIPKSGIAVQRDTSQQSTRSTIEERRSERFPWIGRIHGTSSAALRRIPGKDSENPHAGTLADLVEGKFVDVLGREKGWLHVQATVDGKELQGYVSQELVEFNRSDSPQASAGPPLKDILRLDQTIPIKGLAKDQPNYIDHFRGRFESAPVGTDITFVPNTGPASQTGVSISKDSFYIDKDPLTGFSLGQNGVYKSRAIAEAVVAALTEQSPNIPIYTYYLQDGIIFPTTLSETTIPNMMPFIRQKREQDLADLQATAGLAQAVANTINPVPCTEVDRNGSLTVNPSFGNCVLPILLHAAPHIVKGGKGGASAHPGETAKASEHASARPETDPATGETTGGKTSEIAEAVANNEINGKQLAAEVAELRNDAGDPAKVNQPADPNSPYDAEMATSDGHEFHREKETQLWERCSTPPCKKGLKLDAEIDKEVDAVVKTKAKPAAPKSSPPRTAADVISSGNEPLRPGKSELGQYGIDEYGTYSNRPSDKFAGHEMLQNAWLEAKGYGERLKSAASRKNPAVALSHNEHVAVGREQKALGLFDRNNLVKMSAEQVIKQNALAMKNAGVPDYVIAALEKEALRYAATLKPPGK